MHVIVKFLNSDGHEVDNERYLFCPSLYVDSIIISAFSDSDKLLDITKLDVN